jgi:hypothetical protein
MTCMAFASIHIYFTTRSAALHLVSYHSAYLLASHYVNSCKLIKIKVKTVDRMRYIRRIALCSGFAPSHPTQATESKAAL